ncbi:hypothetical protein M433DRAFT_283017 [Acidomyces richmondensis BFW]|nr:MAG: hypothetical protein FE78DRAFT_408311 [Acidomyces sp. 'richmondensis']KYG50629.1 hypothetical protein M433DRAFT_283017 [Acidomyces richmondensis BFW]
MPACGPRGNGRTATPSFRRITVCATSGLGDIRVRCSPLSLSVRPLLIRKAMICVCRLPRHHISGANCTTCLNLAFGSGCLCYGSRVTPPSPQFFLTADRGHYSLPMSARGHAAVDSRPRELSKPNHIPSCYGATSSPRPRALHANTSPRRLRPASCGSLPLARHASRSCSPGWKGILGSGAVATDYNQLAAGPSVPAAKVISLEPRSTHVRTHERLPTHTPTSPCLKIGNQVKICLPLLYKLSSRGRLGLLSSEELTVHKGV